MFEELDDIFAAGGPDGEPFKEVERTVQTHSFPDLLNAFGFPLTPQNTTVRLFAGKQAVYSRAVVDCGDGSTASVGFDYDFLRGMANHHGFPETWPKQLDESDHEFFQNLDDFDR